ncbi:hypothetical protein Pmar_PMAR003688 [Perkinsus marinus ATCC 50983]|uniref:Phospholipase/carboxylesterase/thioesterase domain-containing protein n=1 Tax=Perkinsus marinus (strain ATCC 50983 / TXsc) TaxID=423536 RepID=C5KI13_PERM5|nr:hypothetical protein Pmar_PMAR003688 [Perkinsus marinus ATCC 50983]EER16225.1 hypothetical protein Pmar_PMAR003688 [Perkinsus marinus ATCC 50983]|eukprot:XP_002784429.1 hypothetical protein Pmar_PMAR003688 [Perkinsus marinus ATCC 50983]
MAVLMAVLGSVYGEPPGCHVFYMQDRNSSSDSALFNKHKQAFFKYLVGQKDVMKARAVRATCPKIEFEMFTITPSPHYPGQPGYTDPTDQQLINSLAYITGHINRIANRIPLQSIFLIGVYSGAAIAIQTVILYPGKLGGVFSFAGWIPLSKGAAHLIKPAQDEKMVLAASGFLDSFHSEAPTEEWPWGTLSSMMARPTCGVVWLAHSQMDEVENTLITDRPGQDAFDNDKYE